MEQHWHGRDRGLIARMGLTIFGLGLLYVVFMAVIIATGASAVVVVVIAGIVAFVQLMFSDRLALRSVGARVVEPQEEPRLHTTIDRLCQLADVAKPQVAVSRMDVPNAFAAGRSQKRATICVTTGLLERLDQEELEGVLAHELTHIINRDVVVMTVASFLATVAGLLIRMGFYARSGRGNTAAVLVVVLVASAVTYALSYILLRALSRYREYAADRGAASITGAPSQLASALLKVSGEMSRIPDRDLRAAEPMNAFFILPVSAKGLSISSLFATHPPTEARVARLMDMQAQIDRRAPRVG